MRRFISVMLLTPLSLSVHHKRRAKILQTSYFYQHSAMKLLFTLNKFLDSQTEFLVAITESLLHNICESVKGTSPAKGTT